MGAPKIQRLVTPITLQRRRRKKCLMRNNRARSKEEREAYQQLLDQRVKRRKQSIKMQGLRQADGKRRKEIIAIANTAARAEKAAAAAKAPKGKATKSKTVAPTADK